MQMPSLRKYCYVHKIEVDDQPSKDQLLHAILRHWKRQVFPAGMMPLAHVQSHSQAAHAAHRIHVREK